MSPTKAIRLRDGRVLAFTEHGDLSGSPIIFIHGNPGSRLVRHPDETIAENLGARIITPDRPGYGFSDFQPNRTLLDFPDDMAQLADALELDKFAVFGLSAGGPHAAACAYKLAERLTQVAIVSGAAPLDREDAYAQMGSTWQTSFKLAAKLPAWLLRMLVWIQTRLALRNPEKALIKFGETLTASDREILARPAIRDGVIGRHREATRRGVRGLVREAKILTSPWGFPPEDIRVKVHLWYWEDDPAIPLQMGKYLASRIPHHQTHFFPGGGHLSFFDYWGEIIETLIKT